MSLYPGDSFSEEIDAMILKADEFDSPDDRDAFIRDAARRFHAAQATKRNEGRQS